MKKESKEEKLYKPSKTGAIIKNPKETISIALSQVRKKTLGKLQTKNR